MGQKNINIKSKKLNQKLLQSAFTIVELLVVIVIIGILAAITMVSYNGVTKKATEASLQTDLSNSAKALKIYKGFHDSYPTALDSNNCPTAPVADSTICLKTSHGNSLTYISDGETFGLEATNTNGLVYSATNSSSPQVGRLPKPPTFITAWGGVGSDYGRSITQTDGGLAVTGQTTSFGAGTNDMFIAKYDSTGTLLWDKTWGGTSSDYGYSITQTSDGGLAVTGYTNSFGAGIIDMFIAKYDSTGTLLWDKTWGGARDDYGRSITQTSDGGLAVAGYTNSFGAGNYDIDMFIAKYSSNGTLLWDKTWGGASYEYGESIIQTSDGGLAVTGQTRSFGAGNGDMFIAKYSSDGTLLWDKTWGGVGSEYGYSITQTSDGGLAVTGFTNGFGVEINDMFIAKHSSDGTLLWDRTWGGANDDYGRSITQTSDGGLAVAGFTPSFGTGGYAVFIAKYSSDGTLLWDKILGVSGAGFGYSITQTSDGGLAVTSDIGSFGAGGRDMFIAKCLTDGSINGCVSPMCQDPNATENNPNATENNPNATDGNPSATVNDPTATELDPSATTNMIVES